MSREYMALAGTAACVRQNSYAYIFFNLVAVNGNVTPNKDTRIQGYNFIACSGNITKIFIYNLKV